MATEKRPHGLLLLFEGLPATVVQSQVFTRIRWLEANAVATFDVLAFAHDRDLLRASGDRLAGLKSEISGTLTLARAARPGVPGSRLINRSLLANWLARTGRRYDFIQARTDYAAAVAASLPEASPPLVWDCRGDAEGEVLDRLRPHPRTHRLTAWRPLTVWRAQRFRRDGARAAQRCAAASFVSTALAQKWSAALGDRPHFVIPCLADPAHFYFDPQLRAATRAQMGYAPEDVVFVYSGSLAPYQGFDLMKAWFGHACMKNPDARLLVLTPRTREARRRLAGLPPERVDVRSLAFNDVNAALNAADYAFMLRPQNRANKAAFPTKFAEFGHAGLPVICTGSTPDCHAYAARLGNLVRPNSAPETLKAPETRYRQAVMDRYRHALSHDAFAAQSRALYAAATVPRAVRNPGRPLHPPSSPVSSEFGGR